MAHGADRIANFMRDAGAQAPEGGELRLLHALRDQRGVFQEDQRRALAVLVECHEMRLHQAAAIRGQQAQ